MSMISALALALATNLPIGPVKYPGANELFYQTTFAIESKLEKKDFYGAERLAKTLPAREVAIVWDAASIPVARRDEFAAARNAVMKELEASLIGVKLKLAPKGDIKISFTERIPGPQGAPMGKGMALFTSPSLTEQRVESVIALKRGAPEVPSQFADVHAGVARTILAYFGVGTAQFPGPLAHEYDAPLPGQMRLDGSEILLVRRNLQTADAIHELIRKKKQVAATRPSIRIDVKEVKLPDAVQGDVSPFVFQVTNLGDSVLIFHARPDCSCLSSDPALSIDPGQTALVKGQIDTREFVGQLDKKLFIATNDPERSRVTIPVSIFVRPVYRLIPLSGRTQYVDDQPTKDVEFLLWSDETLGLKPTSASVEGIEGSATFEPFEGLAADPEMNEAAKMRKGYRVKMTLKRPAIEGRYFANVIIRTESPGFRTLRSGIALQTGIVALPGSVYFGEVPRAARQASFIVSRPGRDFKILKVDADVDVLKGSAVPIQGKTEYRVTIELDGRQELGMLNGMVRVHTDDPRQKIVYVPFQAFVK